jgi:hypothetical protein
MPTSSTYTDVSSSVSTGLIIALVVGVGGGIACCIGVIVVIICMIKQCNKPRTSMAGGMILEPYPNNAPYYPPVNPPAYQPPQQPVYGPYTAPQPLVSQLEKPQITRPRPTTVSKPTDEATKEIHN